MPIYFKLKGVWDVFFPVSFAFVRDFFAENENNELLCGKSSQG